MLSATPSHPQTRQGSHISGQHLARVHDVYRRWLGDDYDLQALDVVLSAAAAEALAGDPPWLLVIGGSGAAKTETLMPLTGAAAHVVSTISGEAALLSGTSTKERAKGATGGLLPGIGERGLLVIKDVTSILSMNRDTRALVLAALREIYDGHWSRNVGTDGGKTLTWSGRLVVIGACTTAWDAAHQVIATMGDRFVLVRLEASAQGRLAAGRQAMRNVSTEVTMRQQLAEAVGKLLGIVSSTGRIQLDDDEIEHILGLADLVTRARTGVERDYQGNPMNAHALEMPTRLAKQLVQLARGGIAIGMTREQAMAVVERCAVDTMPPLRFAVLADVATNGDSFTADVVKRLQLPRKTVDRVLQELQLLSLLRVHDVSYGSSVRWVYSLEDDVDRASLDKLSAEKLARNVSTGIESASQENDQ